MTGRGNSLLNKMDSHKEGKKKIKAENSIKKHAHKKFHFAEFLFLLCFGDPTPR